MTTSHKSAPISSPVAAARLAPLPGESRPLNTVLHVYIDTREQTPLVFPETYVDIFGDEWTILTSRRKLDDGQGIGSGIDYTVQGLERHVGITRKSHGDFIGSISTTPKDVRERRAALGSTEVSGWDAFSRQLDRLSAMAYALLLIEATPADILRGTKWSMFNPKAALAKALSIHVRYRIPVLMVKREAAAAAVLERMTWAARYLDSQKPSGGSVYQSHG